MTFDDELRKAFHQAGKAMEDANEAFMLSGAKRAAPQRLREVTSNGKRFVVRRDEHGEYYEALGDAPATRDEGQAQP